MDVTFQISQCGAIICQEFVDRFAWQLFIALNWPSNGSGGPNTGAAFGTPGDLTPVVWETFANVADVFATPAPTAAGASPGTSSSKKLTGTSAVIHLTETQQVDRNWLTDQNGNLVYYELRINPDEYQYIIQNSLNTQEGLYAAFQSGGSGVMLPTGQTGVSTGAIEIKAAWRIVPADKVSSYQNRYKLSQALIGASTTPVTVALVGLHIVKKTPTFPQMVWATFEHQDNAPDPGAVKPGVDYAFYNPKAPANYVPSYTSPPQKFGAKPTPQSTPVQIVRVNPIEPSAPPITSTAHSLISAATPSSVWLNYQLVSAQWPTKPAPVSVAVQNAPLPTGTPAPTVLGNTTMESYLQTANSGGGAGLTVDGGNDGTVSPADFNKSSCIGCHRLAGTTPPFAAHPGQSWYTDYSAIFFKAQPASK